MFKRKYLFETKMESKFKKYILLVPILIVLFIIYSLLAYGLIYYAKLESEKTYTALYQKSPDLLVVFTGDVGRINFAINKAHEFNAPKIYISGVHKKNSIETLMKEQLNVNYSSYASQNLENFTEIDYQAQNTIENIVQTLNYIRENKDFSKVLIVSSDYHILRINMALNSMMKDSDNFNFYYLGSPTDYTHFRNIKILYREVFKFFRTLFFLVVWDKEI
ncbi:MAG: YdcF family protein [Bacteriovoracaceae bacterium]